MGCGARERDAHRHDMRAGRSTNSARMNECPPGARCRCVDSWWRVPETSPGYFEIGALVSLAEKWQTVDHIRILMGDEVSYRTKRAFTRGLERIQGQLDQSNVQIKGPEVGLLQDRYERYWEEAEDIYNHACAIQPRQEPP
jgi:hypothetical protein